MWERKEEKEKERERAKPQNYRSCAQPISCRCTHTYLTYEDASKQRHNLTLAYTTCMTCMMKRQPRTHAHPQYVVLTRSRCVCEWNSGHVRTLSIPSV